MAKKIEARFASMDEMAAALTAYLDGQTTPRWGRKLAMAGGVAAVSLAVWLGLSWLPSTGKGKNLEMPSENEKGKEPREKPGSGELSGPVRGWVQDLSHRDASRRASAAKALEAEGNKAVVPDLTNRIADDLWDGDEDRSKDAALSALKRLAKDQVAVALDRAS